MAVDTPTPVKTGEIDLGMRRSGFANLAFT
jgi:hypothetical protein